MSNLSGASSGSSSSRSRGRVFGLPKSRCWCWEKIIQLISKSESNPYRRYYRCGYAVANKLANDNHIFKWIDEAHLNEIETLKTKIAKLEEKLEEVTTERKEYEIFERMEKALDESSSNTKKMMIVAVIGCMVIVGVSKRLG